jgi:hypothetical protein
MSLTGMKVGDEAAYVASCLRHLGGQNMVASVEKISDDGKRARVGGRWYHVRTGRQCGVAHYEAWRPSDRDCADALATRIAERVTSAVVQHRLDVLQRALDALDGKTINE